MKECERELSLFWSQTYHRLPLRVEELGGDSCHFLRLHGVDLSQHLIERAVTEVVDVARARGVALPDDEGPRTCAYIDTLPGTMKPSFLLDVEAGGPTELETLSGAVARFAADAGIDCPVHETVRTVLNVR